MSYNSSIFFLNKYIEYFIFIILIIFFYYYLFNNADLDLYYRQYDIIGNLISINRNESYFLNDPHLLVFNLIKKFLNSNNEIYVYKHYCFIIFILNIFSLFFYLKTTNLNKLDNLIIILVFSFFPNFFLRMDYGHSTLLQYYHFFLILTFFEFFINKNKKIYLLLIFLTILLSFYNNIQYGIYIILLFTIYVIYKIGLKNTLLEIKKNFTSIILSALLLVVIILTYKFERIKEFIELKRLIFDLEYVNKYSLINPLEFFWNFNFIYEKLEFFFNDSIKNKIQEYSKFLNYYSPNGPEFTFYYGPTFLVCFISNFYHDKKFYLIFITSFILIILFTLNSIYLFSLIYVHHFFFPFIRSIQRAYIIFDILIILSLIKIFINFKDSKWNILKIIFVIITIFFLKDKNHKGINYDIDDFILSNEKNYSFSLSNVKEEIYFIKFLELKNNFKLNDSLEQVNKIKLNFNERETKIYGNVEIFLKY